MLIWLFTPLILASTRASASSSLRHTDPVKDFIERIDRYSLIEDYTASVRRLIEEQPIDFVNAILRKADCELRQIILELGILLEKEDIVKLSLLRMASFKRMPEYLKARKASFLARNRFLKCGLCTGDYNESEFYLSFSNKRICKDCQTNSLSPEITEDSPKNSLPAWNDGFIRALEKRNFGREIDEIAASICETSPHDDFPWNRFLSETITGAVLDRPYNWRDDDVASVDSTGEESTVGRVEPGEHKAYIMQTIIDSNIIPKLVRRGAEFTDYPKLLRFIFFPLYHFFMNYLIEVLPNGMEMLQDILETSRLKKFERLKVVTYIYRNLSKEKRRDLDFSKFERSRIFRESSNTGRRIKSLINLFKREQEEAFIELMAEDRTGDNEKDEKFIHRMLEQKCSI
jgi:hypothetical protein